MIQFELGTTRRIRVRQYMARRKGMFREFVAVPLKQTRQAVYLYGRGTTKAHSNCMFCGRKLTNDISRYLGVGPHCGGHHYNYPLTEENRDMLAKMIEATVIDGWFPKSSIEANRPTDEVVSAPDDHEMLKPNGKGTKTQPTKHAEAIGNTINIHFPYDKAVLAKIRTLHGRGWNKEKKFWYAPFALQTVQQLKEWGFAFGPALSAMVEKADGHLYTAAEVAGFLAIDGLQKELYPFQHEGVAFVESRDGCAIIGDEMGLGKTPEALAYIQLQKNRGIGPALVVCPATLKQNWRREALTWMRKDTVVHVISGRGNGEQLPKADVYIINYDIIAESVPAPCESCKGSGKYEWASEAKPCVVCSGTGQHEKKKEVNLRQDIVDIKPQIVVLDECHYIKNRKAQRTRAIMQLRKIAPQRLALSGTPIINRPVEYFNTLSFVAPERFPSFWNFAKRYCGAIQGAFGWDFSGATNTKELHDVLTSTVLIRRTKAEVLTELPPKQRSVIPMPVTNPKRYDSAQESMRKELIYVFGEDGVEWNITKGNAGAEALTRIERLKQVAVAEKLPSAMQWIRDYLEEADKLVVFATHQNTIDVLMAELAEFDPVAIDGRTPQNRRQNLVDKFQTDPACRLFVGNIKAAGVGLTLTAANATCFLELGWTPGEHDQAEDRVHRIGQKADSVNAYYLVAENTIEEEITQLIDEKREVLSQVLDGKDVESTALLTELIRRFRDAA